MNLKDEKGITGIDVIISIILITLFIIIITTISANINKNSKKIEHESEALYYAISIIENIKSQDFSILPVKGNEKIQGVPELADGYIKDDEGADTPYYKTIIVEDYSEKNTSKQPEVLKKITVKIQYKDNNKIKDVTLSTIKTKEA